MLDTDVMKCIREYVSEKYVGGVISISDVSLYCGCSEGKLLRGLVALEKQDEIKIEKRYSCPEFHYLREESLPYCDECDYEYPEEMINVYFYFKPLATVKVE